jgi:hypothetical protein
MAECGRKQDANDFVLYETEPLGAAPAVTVLEQQGLSRGARGDQFGLEQVRHCRAEHVLAAGMQIGQRVDRAGDARGVEWRIRLSAGLGYDVIHAVTGYRTTPSLSRNIPK